MTNEEAIYVLKNTTWLGSDEDIEEAVKTAIFALAQVTITDDPIDRYEAMDAMYALCNEASTLAEDPWRDNPHIDNIIDALKNLPSAQPSISCSHGNDLEDVTDTNISDIIYRQSAINAIENTECELSSEEWDELTDAILNIPSAQPEPKRPIWKAEDRYVKNRFTVFPYCPQCNVEITTGQCFCMICGQQIDWSEENE